MNGLSVLAETAFGQDELKISWFVFISRDKKKVKILYWRGSGLAMWQYRLEKDLFEMGRPRRKIPKRISWKELGLFLDGYNIFEGLPHDRSLPKRYS
jgi:transposase